MAAARKKTTPKKTSTPTSKPASQNPVLRSANRPPRAGRSSPSAVQTVVPTSDDEDHSWDIRRIVDTRENPNTGKTQARVLWDSSWIDLDAFSDQASAVRDCLRIDALKAELAQLYHCQPSDIVADFAGRLHVNIIPSSSIQINVVPSPPRSAPPAPVASPPLLHNPNKKRRVRSFEALVSRYEELRVIVMAAIYLIPSASSTTGPQGTHPLHASAYGYPTSTPAGRHTACGPSFVQGYGYNEALIPRYTSSHSHGGEASYGEVDIDDLCTALYRQALVERERERQRQLQLHQQRQRAIEVERRRREYEVLLEQEHQRALEIERRRRIAIAQAQARAQVIARAQAQAQARLAAERAQHERSRQYIAQKQQQDLESVLEHIFGGAVVDIFGGLREEASEKTQPKHEATATAQDKDKGKAINVNNGETAPTLKQPTPTLSSRDDLAAKTAAQAQDALLSEDNLKAFTSAFGDLFQEVFGQTPSSKDTEDKKDSEQPTTRTSERSIGVTSSAPARVRPPPVPPRLTARLQPHHPALQAQHSPHRPPSAPPPQHLARHTSATPTRTARISSRRKTLFRRRRFQLRWTRELNRERRRTRTLLTWR
ncbi:hypothetical protein CF326_g8223 [Tilletia indica]|nr:hypothetical protein CF326_g8223 [Tilletia indica]